MFQHKQRVGTPGGGTYLVFGGTIFRRCFQEKQMKAVFSGVTHPHWCGGGQQRWEVCRWWPTRAEVPLAVTDHIRFGLAQTVFRDPSIKQSVLVSSHGTRALLQGQPLALGFSLRSFDHFSVPAAASLWSKGCWALKQRRQRAEWGGDLTSPRPSLRLE